MHRSGTSLCARILSALGVDIAEEAGPGPGNEEGHWERWELVELHNRILASLNRRNGDIGEYMPLHDLALPPTWWDLPIVQAARSEIEAYLDSRIRADTIFGFKDPRVSRLLPMWNEILDRKGLSARFVLCLRNPNEVADSLWKRDCIPHPVGLYRWLLYTCEFMAHVGVECHFVNYEDWFDSPEETATRLAAFVGTTIPEESTTFQEVLGAISSQHRHNVSLPPSASSLVGRVYQLLRQRAPSSGDIRTAATLSREIVTFSQAVPFEAAFIGLQTDAQSSASTIEHLRAEAAAKGQFLAEQEQLVGELRRSLLEGHGLVGELQQSIAEHEASLRSLQQLLARRDESLESLRQSLAERDGSLKALQQSLTERDDAMAALQHSVAAREQALGLFEDRLAQTLRVQAESSPVGVIDWLRVARDYLLVKRSGLFDASWYSRHYPVSPSHTRRPLVFFLSRGWLAGDNPNRMFDTKWYLERYPDVRRAHVNPVVHYLYRGASEGRDPSAKFSTASYRRDHPELGVGQLNPLAHYLKANRAAGTDNSGADLDTE